MVIKIHPVLAVAILLTVVAILFVPTRCSQAVDYGTEEYRWVAREVAWQALHYSDWMQTRQIARQDGYHEYNPLLGSDPSLDSVNRYMATSAALHLAASYYIPAVMAGLGAPDSWVKNSRAVFQYVTLGLTAGCVANNYSIGLRVSF